MCSDRCYHCALSKTIIMAIELTPLPLPTSADSSRFTDFGRQVIGLHPGKLTPEQLTEIQEALYKARHIVIIDID